MRAPPNVDARPLRRSPGAALAGAAIFAAATVLPHPADGAGWQSVSAGGMEVDVYVPASKSPVGAGRSLLVALHGCTQTAATLRQQGNFETAGDDFGMVVALPTVPDGGVLAGCWDYYGGDHARTGRHDGPLLDLTSTLLADESLEIDNDQVYVAGLSSGAGEAMVLGCLAPDVFAGVGIAAGPTVGTTAAQISLVSTTESEAAALCQKLAGASTSSFATQLASLIAGSNDYVVAQGYEDLNAEVLGAVYGGATGLASSDLAVDALPGYQPAGAGEVLSDGRGPRVSKIRATGMGHAWPAGSGPGTEMSFVAPSGVAYARYLAGFFSGNTLRAGAAAAGAGGAGGGTSSTSGEAGSSARGADEDDGGCSTAPRRGGGAAPLVLIAALAVALGVRRRFVK